MDIHFEQEHEALKKIANKRTLWIGLGFDFAIIITELFIFFTKSHNNTTILAIPIFLFIAGVITSTFLYRSTLKGIAFFGEIFSNGFKTIALMVIILVAWIFLSIQIFPEIKEIDIELARKSMLSSNYDEQQLNESLEMYKDNKIYYLGKVFNLLRINFLLGIIITVVLGMFLRAKSND